MATAPLIPSADLSFPSPWYLNSGFTTAWETIKDDPASPNPSETVNCNAVSGGVTFAVQLGGAPGDIQTTTAASLHIAIWHNGWVDDTIFMSATVLRADGLDTYCQPVYVFQNANVDTILTLPMTLSTSGQLASQAQWNSARLEITYSRTASMGTDAGINTSIRAARILLTYTPSQVTLPGSVGTVRVTGVAGTVVTNRGVTSPAYLVEDFYRAVSTDLNDTAVWTRTTIYPAGTTVGTSGVWTPLGSNSGPHVLFREPYGQPANGVLELEWQGWETGKSIGLTVYLRGADLGFFDDAVYFTVSDSGINVGGDGSLGTYDISANRNGRCRLTVINRNVRLDWKPAGGQWIEGVLSGVIPFNSAHLKGYLNPLNHMGVKFYVSSSLTTTWGITDYMQDLWEGAALPGSVGVIQVVGVAGTCSIPQTLNGTITTNWGGWTGVANGARVAAATITTVWNLDRALLQDVPSNTTAPGTYTFGLGFAPTVAGTVTHLRYWCQTAGTHTVSLWRQSDQAKLASVVDSGATVGWREILLPTPVQVSAGISYISSFTSDGTAAGTNGAGVAPIAASPRLTIDFAYFLAGADVYPSTISSGHYFADLRFMVNMAAATATVAHVATITTPWGTWTASATAQPIQRNATGASNWGAWTGTAAATRNTAATSTQPWGTWTATAVAVRNTAATSTQPWGVWTASAAGTITAGFTDRPATITDNWGAWTSTATAVRATNAVITTVWNTERFLSNQAPETSAFFFGTLGARIQPQVFGTITHIRYWNWAGSSQDIHIWDRFGTLVRSQIDIASGGTGWREIALNVPYPVGAGETITVSYSTAGNAARTNSTPPALTSTFVIVGSYAYHSDSSNTYPTTADSGLHHHVDVVFDIDPAFATAAGTRSTAATGAANWGTWTGTAIGVRNTAATSTQPWGTWTASAAATRNTAASSTQPWGTWTASATAQPIQRNATITTPWGTWVSTATGRRTSEWSSTASATTQPGFADIPATINGFGGTWTATATATRNTAATITTPWGLWTASAAGTVIAEVINATITTPWGPWTASATAQGIEHPATISTPWGTWVASGAATPLVSGFINDNWGAWVATAAGVRNTPATITTPWAAWTASATAVRTVVATGASTWGAWTATAAATRTTAATILTPWGTWVATAAAGVEHSATITTPWGAWTATANGNALAEEIFATITTNWAGSIGYGAQERVVSDSEAHSSTGAGNYTLGLRFIPTVAGRITHYRFKYVGGFGEPVSNPRALSIWTNADGVRQTTQIWNVDDPTTTHWVEVPLTTPYVLSAGIGYSISMHSASYGYGSFYPLTNTAPNISVPEGFYAGADQFPASSAGGYHYLMDMVFQGTAIIGWAASADGTVTAEVIPATGASNWGSWAASAAGTVIAEEIFATITTPWGAWTAAATAQPIQRNATISTPWGTWNAAFVAVVEHSATIATPWGLWVASGAAIPAVTAFGTSAWGSWTASATASRDTTASISTPWGIWTASATGIRTMAATGSSTWGAWTASAAGVRTTSATGASVWGTWTATAAGTRDIVANSTQSWGAWTAAAAATRTTAATVSTPWGNWVASANANVIAEEIFATISTPWGVWTAAASTTIDHPATITTPWGAWTASATAQPLQRNATITTDWSNWTAATGAQIEHPATITLNWGSWSAYAAAQGQISAVINTPWGNWYADGTATLIKGPQTWAGSTSDIGVSGQSGTFSAGALTWSGSTAEIAVAAVSAAMTGGTTTWSGSTAQVGVAGTSGSFSAGALVWVGSTAAVGVAGVSALFTPGTVTWAGSTAAVGVAATSAPFGIGDVTWAGSQATVGVAGTSAPFVPSPVTWAGSTAAVGVAGTSAAFTPGTVTWVGTTAAVGVAGTSGLFTTPPPQTWVGSTAEISVAAVSGAYSSGTQWGGSQATIGVAGVSGSFTAGALTWAGSTAAIGVAGTSAPFSAGDITWAGSTAQIGVAGISAPFTPGATTWAGSTAQVGVAGTSGPFIGASITWTGSTASIGIEGVSGAITAGALTWTGSDAQVGVAGTSGVLFGGATTWTGSTAEVGAAGVSGSFSAGALTWIGSTAGAGIAGVSGLFEALTVVWVGAEGTVNVVGVSDLFLAGTVTWVGSEALVNISGVTGSITSGIEGQWEGLFFSEMMWGSEDVVEWMLTPA